MIFGNKEGIRETVLSQLEALYDYEVPADEFITAEMLALLASCSCATGREISVYISRSGAVLDVSVGDAHTVGLRDIRLRRNERRLNMIRCIHTHPGGDAALSDADLSSLRAMRFDAMAAVGVLDGKPVNAQAAFLDVEGETLIVHTTRVLPASRIPHARWMDMIRQADEALSGQMSAFATGEPNERAFLCGLSQESSLAELERLAESAGAVVVGRMVQRKEKPDTATYWGSGKIDALALACQSAEADLVIFDDELTPLQMRNLETLLSGVKVIDRTGLILDIFALRAKSKEGKLQVELAQMAYQLPRLTGKGLALSRLGGGIGTRGPGETRLEMDRRRIRRRMTDLRAQIDALSAQRELRRTRRTKSGLPVAALVGYTNAGKTTLLNRLSGSSENAEDKLFATLDPLTRTVPLPSGGSLLLTDTVGFVNKLPHTLVDAFRSTLEETLQADLLILVSDAASPDMEMQREVVHSVLRSLKADDKAILEVLNKADLAGEDRMIPGLLPVSALNGQGIEALLQEIERRLMGAREEIVVRIPYENASVLNGLYRDSKVLSVQYRDDATEVLLSADADTVLRLRRLADNGIVLLEAAGRREGERTC